MVVPVIGRPHPRGLFRKDYMQARRFAKQATEQSLGAVSWRTAMIGNDIATRRERVCLVKK
jgi:hypothetical protein